MPGTDSSVVENGVSALSLNSSVKLNSAISNEKPLIESTDPQCNPNNPIRVNFQDVTSAAFLIKNGVERTPCVVSSPPAVGRLRVNFLLFVQRSRFSKNLGMDIWLKMEFLQYTGR